MEFVFGAELGAMVGDVELGGDVFDGLLAVAAGDVEGVGA